MSMKKILAVDRYQHNLDIYYRVLSPNYSLMINVDPIAALGILRNNEPIDLLIADYSLQGTRDITGNPLVIEAHSIRPSMKIILTTSSILSADQESLERVLAQLKVMGLEFAHLPKPINEETLAAKVEEFIGR